MSSPVVRDVDVLLAEPDLRIAGVRDLIERIRTLLATLDRRHYTPPFGTNQPLGGSGPAAD